MLWAKSKETKIEPCSEVNPVESEKDEEEQKEPEATHGSRKLDDHETSAYKVEQV